MYLNEIIQEDLNLLMKQQDISYEILKNKTILITGATGMLASYYTYTLMKLNDDRNYNIKLILLVRNRKKLEKTIDLKNRNDIVVIEQDVCDKLDIENDIDYIIHMASASNPKTIVTDPISIIDANVFGTKNMLELARKKNAQIIFTSTREVYGKMPEDTTEIKEEDMGVINPLDLRSCYPESKKLAENLIISYQYQYGIDYKIARIAHVYGPGMNIQSDGRIMSDLIENVVNNKNIVLKSTGEALRAFCYIVDAISALFYITTNSEVNMVYNIANETEEIAIKDLAYMLEKMYFDKNIAVEFQIEADTRKYVNFKRVKLNTKKLEELGWKPIIKLEEGVQKTIKSFL